MATKRKRKNRKSPQFRKLLPPAKFSVGDRVRVKAGISDFDYPDIPIGGWAGTVTKIVRGKSPFYEVEWNQATLDNMHPVFQVRCERDGLDMTQYQLGEEDIEPDAGDPLPMEQPTRIVPKPLNPARQDDRIQAIFGLTSDDPMPKVSPENLRKYHAWLSVHLTFPFRATYWRETGPFECTRYNVNAMGLTDVDEYDLDDGYGLLCEIEHDDEPRNLTVTHKRLHEVEIGLLKRLLWHWVGLPISDKEEEPIEKKGYLPLDDLEPPSSSRRPKRKRDPQWGLIDDYSYWLCNYRE